MNVAFLGDANCIHFNKWVNFYANNNKVAFICYDSEINENITKHENISYYPIIPKIYSISNYFENKRILKHLNTILKENKVEIIHSSYIIPFAFWCYDLKSIDYVVTSHGSDILVEYRHGFSKKDGSIKQWLINKILKNKTEKAINRARFVISTSKSQQDIIKSFIKDESKMKLIRVGVDVQRFISVYNQQQRTEFIEEYVICCPRLIRRLYNTHIIVEAFAMMIVKYPLQKFKLLLLDYLSEPEYLEEINEKITSLKIKDQVKILPTLNFIEMAQLYHNTNLIVMIPSSDGSPVTGIEAMLAKKPLIIGNIPYDREIFNEKSVWINQEFTTESLLQKIIEVYNMPEAEVEIKTNYAFNLANQYADTIKETKKVQELYGIRDFQQCKHCVQDNVFDNYITFDENGICIYCQKHFSRTLTKLDKDAELIKNKQTLTNLINQIKKSGENKKYDCILGISGGVDSSYLALIAKKLGLRTLVVHYDNGWNSELAVNNIQNIVQKLDFDLFTYVNDWNEFKDIQLAFLRASVVDIELITDHAIFATLYKIAKKYNIKYILAGSNYATESVLPETWHHLKTDALNIKAIHKVFGKTKLKTYPYTNFFNRIKIDIFKNIQTISLLDLIEYNKDEAKKTLINEVDWRDYGGKHFESIFTRFYQGYILPKKFKIEKRKAHLSSLILSGQITREEAIKELESTNYPEDLMLQDKEFVLKKFDLNEEQFDNLMALPIKNHLDYPSYITRHYKYLGYISKIFKWFK